MVLCNRPVLPSVNLYQTMNETDSLRNSASLRGFSSFGNHQQSAVVHRLTGKQITAEHPGVEPETL